MLHDFQQLNFEVEHRVWWNRWRSSFLAVRSRSWAGDFRFRTHAHSSNSLSPARDDTAQRKNGWDPAVLLHLSKTKPLVKLLSSCSLTVLYPSGRWPLPFRRIRTTPPLISCACNASSLQELAGSAHALGSEGVVDFSSSSSCRITQLRPSHSLRSGHFTSRAAHDVLTQLLPAGHVTATAPSRRGLKITARVRLELSHGIYSLLRCNRTWARVYLNTSSTSSPGIATHHALAVGESTPRTNVAGPFTASRQAVARPLCAEFTAAGSHRASDAAPRFSPPAINPKNRRGK